jgi:hypothetical protein
MTDYVCKTKPNDPVHPEGMVSGITIREHFAGLAMQGYCSNANLTDTEWVVLSEWSVSQADALIEALNKETK